MHAKVYLENPIPTDLPESIRCVGEKLNLKHHFHTITEWNKFPPLWYEKCMKTVYQTAPAPRDLGNFSMWGNGAYNSPNMILWPMRIHFPLSVSFTC